MSGESPPWRLRVHETLASTQDVVLAAAAAGEPEGLAVLALQQSAGRGTQGRAWSSPPGNLYLSLLWRPPGPARDMPQWSLLVAVALAETLSETLPPDAALSLKWPNDLLLDGAKCAGILTDAAMDGNGGIGWLVFGIGVNLAHAPVLPDRPTASLAAAGASPEAPPAVAARLLFRLSHWRERQGRDGFAPIRAAWTRQGPPLGATLRVRGPRGLVEGRFAGLDARGHLLLDAADRRWAMASGEVTG